MSERTVLAISRMDADELRIKLENGSSIEKSEARQHLADLLWEAVHCPPDLSWLQPSPQEV